MRLAGPARGVHVVQERVEAAAGDELDPAGRDALGVVGGGAERVGERRVVDERDRRAPATSSPSRPTNSERPFTIASPESAPPSSASTERVTSGSSTTGSRRDGGLRRAEEADRALGGVVRGLRRASSSANAPPDREAAAGLGLGALARHRERRARAHRAPGRRLDAERVRDRALDRGVAVGRRLHAADARVGGLGRRLRARARARPCRRSGTREHVVAPEVERRAGRRPRRRRASPARRTRRGRRRRRCRARRRRSRR